MWFLLFNPESIIPDLGRSSRQSRQPGAGARVAGRQSRAPRRPSAIPLLCHLPHLAVTLGHSRQPQPGPFAVSTHHNSTHPVCHYKNHGEEINKKLSHNNVKISYEKGGTCVAFDIASDTGFPHNYCLPYALRTSRLKYRLQYLHREKYRESCSN